MSLVPEFNDDQDLRKLGERAQRLAKALEPTATDPHHTVPKPEHPRPSMHGRDWINLNGCWQFEIDPGDSGRERGLLERELNSTITVPFAPESAASGIGHTDFMEAVWYRREVTIPAEWGSSTSESGVDASPVHPVLHFGAVDHDATVWVNGIEVARHRGGFTPFQASLKGIAAPGEKITIVLRARDSRWEPQARGKQSTWVDPTHAYYPRTTGIWQTVWLEAVPEVSIRAVNITPSLADSSFDITVPLTQNAPGTQLEVTVDLRDPSSESFHCPPAESDLVRATIRADLDLAPRVHLSIPEEHVRTWGPGEPELYTISVRLIDSAGATLDKVHSYGGLRSTALHGKSILINGKKVFQRLVLDQGYWPQSLMTAPSDDAILTDIHLSLAAGFNGARLHQKVFEERMLFWADLHGYLVWGEFGDWGVSGRGNLGYNQGPTASFITQWVEAVQRDISHPAIIGWCPLNETHQVLHDRITVLDDVTHGMYQATKLADPSRPVLDVSGYSHRVRGADVYDSHSYEQDPARFRKEQEGIAWNDPYLNDRELPENELPFANGQFNIPYGGQPFFVSEYGGIWWNEEEAAEAITGTDQTQSWGYGDRVRSIDEFYERYEGLLDVLLFDENMFGYCYTQLTDVFQEKNGLVDFDRGKKFDLARLRKLQLRKAAYQDD